MGMSNLYQNSGEAAIRRELPGVLTRLAPLLDPDDPNYDHNAAAFEKWVLDNAARTRAFTGVAVTLLIQYNVLPGTLRAWARTMEHKHIRDWRP